MSASVTSTGISPYSWIYPGSHNGNTALSLFEQGRFADSQIFFKGLRIISLFPTRSARGERGAERWVQGASAPRVENQALETDSPSGAAQRRVIQRSLSLFLSLWFYKTCKFLEQPDGIFSMISAGSAEFIQDNRCSIYGNILCESIRCKTNKKAWCTVSSASCCYWRLSPSMVRFLRFYSKNSSLTLLSC